MKKILCFMICMVIIQSLHAQLVNGSFENWNTTLYSEPDLWFTPNKQTISKAGIATVTAVTGFSGSAVRMETTINGPDTLQAFISNTNGDPVMGIGGIPYAFQPTEITGYYRYQLAG